MVGKIKLRFRKSDNSTYLKDMGILDYNITDSVNLEKNVKVLSSIYKVNSLVTEGLVQPAVRYDFDIREYIGD